MTGRTWRRVSLVITLGSLAVGLLAATVDADDVAEIAWAVGPALLLGPLAWETVRSVWLRRPDVDVIALLAMGGALAAGEVLAGSVIAVMLTGGQALDDLAGGRAERELTALVARAPRTAHLVVDDGLVDVPVEDVVVGDRLLVKPGEVVPVDMRLVAPATMDEAAMTGESRPVRRGPGEVIASGVTNAGGEVRGIAAATAADSAYTAIVRLVESARSAKAPMVRMADRIAAWFVPLTLVIAGGAWILSGDPVRALAVLVVATPCPLLLATPIAMVSGISRAARQGVVVKHGGALESLATARTVGFDKTGTVTSGHPEVVEVVVGEGWDRGEVLRLAASLDQVSTHPFAPAVVAAAGAPEALVLPSEVEEVPGAGIRGVVDGRVVAVGSRAMVDAAEASAVGARPRGGVPVHGDEQGRSAVWVAVDGHVAAVLHLQDPLRPDAADTVSRLRASGIDRVVMISGDRQDVAEAMGAAIGVDAVLAERSPMDKVDAVAAEQALAPTLMVGDGINDAPALAAADVGIAMGARGATASSEAASVVVTVDRVAAVADVRDIAVRTRRIARQSALGGMSLSLVAMAVAAAGHLTPVAGALLQEGIDVVAIVAALRALRPPRSRPAGVPARWR